MPYIDLSWRTYRPEEGFYASELDGPERWPIRTFLPTGYEPNYPYPLLVFFHGHGDCDEQVLRLAPRVSRRNYVCMSLRGPTIAGVRPDGRPGYTWGADGQCHSQIEDYVFGAIEQVRRGVHIHTERIYLAGFREGATLAYRLGLLFPEKFGGVISLNGSLPRRGGPLLRLPEARHLRILIGHGIANPIVPLTMAQADYRLFYTAGMPVRMHTYPTTHRLHPHMLRDVNRWVMDIVNAEE